jgi:hypothetical protein
MNSPLRLGGILLSLCLALSASLRAEVVVDDAGRYAVDMDAPQTRPQPEGKTVIHMLLHEESDTTVYIVSYNDLPTGSAAKLDVVAMFKDAMNASLNGINAEVVSSGAHQLGDLAGWQFISRTKDGKLSTHVRYYLVGERFYQLIFIGPKGSDTGEKCLHFLDSFRLLR